MPTASTSQILGNNECFEPYTSNIYTRRVLSGEFIIVNKYLLRDLVNLGLWTPAMKDKIISANGSVQDTAEIPQEIKDLYKTVWEIKMRNINDMAADRGAYICQSQSLNLFINSPNASKLTSDALLCMEEGPQNRYAGTTCVHRRHRRRLNLPLKIRVAKIWSRLSPKWR